MTLSTLQRQLTEIAGAANVSADAAPFAVAGRAPACAVAPGTVEELAAAVAACAAARVPVVPWGGGTKQRWGRPPAAEQFVVVQTGRLRGALVYEPDDLTISVAAGTTLAELDALLAANGQMLPLDAPEPARATVGGVLATAVDGPRRLAYGTARDLLIGVGVVEATGRVSKAGGMVVKNVSGFDMMKLYLGSLGTLAIIVSANFKLLPRARAAGSLSCRFRAPEPALALAEQIAASQLTPAAVEYHEGWAEAGAPPVALEVRAEGLPAAVERHLRDLEAMARAAGAAEVEALPAAGPELEARWARHGDLAQTSAVADDELVARLSCLPGDLAAAVARARDLAAGHGLGLRVAARALGGVAYLRAQGPDEGLRAWHAGLLAGPAELAVLAARPALAAELPVWGRPPANLELMRRIKAEFDPENLLNPGRYVV